MQPGIIAGDTRGPFLKPGGLVSGVTVGNHHRRPAHLDGKVRPGVVGREGGVDRVNPRFLAGSEWFAGEDALRAAQLLVAGGVFADGGCILGGEFGNGGLCVVEEL